MHEQRRIKEREKEQLNLKSFSIINRQISPPINCVESDISDWIQYEFKIPWRRFVQFSHVFSKGRRLLAGQQSPRGMVRERNSDVQYNHYHFFHVGTNERALLLLGRLWRKSNCEKLYFYSDIFIKNEKLKNFEELNSF